MKTFKILLLSLILHWACAPGAMATPRIAFAWTEVSFKTERGTRLEASCDKQSRLTRLVVIQNGRTFFLPESVMKDIVDVSLHDIEVFEEIRFPDHALIKIRAWETDYETGDLTKKILWSITIVKGKLTSIKHDDTPVPPV